MRKTPATISIQELSEIGRAAGAEAVAASHAAGLATPGMMRLRLASGEELSVLAMSHPDGVVEIRDKRLVIEEKLDISDPTNFLEELRKASQAIQGVMHFGYHGAHDQLPEVYPEAISNLPDFVQEALAKKPKPSGAGKR